MRKSEGAATSLERYAVTAVRSGNGFPALSTADSEKLLSNLAHLDFFGAFGDAIAAVMPIDVFERHVSRVADAAAGLHRPVRRVVREPVGAVVAHRHEVAYRSDPKGLAEKTPERAIWRA